ncbi:MAG: glycerate kinase [Flavobacteriaceae bacterium]
MKYLLIPDKFKGSLTAQEVIDALSSGIRKADPGAVLHSALVSDGGDGFLESISHYGEYERVVCEARNPLGKTIDASYLYEEATDSAYIEMAQTAGLVLIEESDRSPMISSTYGTGMQIRHALEKGARNLFIGLGGSATNDAGLGIAAAMDYRFLDSEGRVLAPEGQNLSRIARIQKPEDESLYADAKIYAINDVNNPLFGPQGAAHVYAAQKGAKADDIRLLDKGLRDFDMLVKREMGKSYASIPGAGAAGGTAYGLMCFLGARFLSGTEFVLNVARVNEILTKNSIDYIITGEGKIDDQTLSGKLIHGVLELGGSYKIPVIAVCGIMDTENDSLIAGGLSTVIEVRDTSRSLAYNMENAATLVAGAIYDFFQNKIG